MSKPKTGVKAKNKKQTKVSTHKVFAMSWTHRDRWSGPEHAGFTLAHDAETLREDARAKTAGRSMDNVPDEYDSPDSYVEAVEVTTETFKRIKKGKALWVSPDTLMKRNL